MTERLVGVSHIAVRVWMVLQVESMREHLLQA
jgi:hypothetical protein